MKIPFTPRTTEALEMAHKIAEERGFDYVGTEDVFMALLNETNGACRTMLEAVGVNGEDVYAKLHSYRADNDKANVEAIKKRAREAKRVKIQELTDEVLRLVAELDK